MIYVLKLLICSAVALTVAGLAINYGPLGFVAHLGDIVLFTYLGVICVGVPGLTWWGTAKLLKVL